MSTCVLCRNEDWVGVGICGACSGQRDQRLVFVAAQPTAMGRADVVRSLREFLSAPKAPSDFVETASGRKPLAIVPAALTAPAMRKLESAGLQARVVPFGQWPRAVPASFVLMAITVLVVGMMAGMRAAPMLLWASPIVALLLLFGAAYQLTRPLLGAASSPSVLPPSVRATLAESLAILTEGRARTMLLDIARLGESTFATLSPAFRTASLGEAVLELLQEAGPLALEAAQLENIAADLKHRTGAEAVAEFKRIDGAVQAHFSLLEHVIALLSRLAREGADSHEEMSDVLKRVRAEAALRAEAEMIVTNLLNSTPKEFAA